MSFIIFSCFCKDSHGFMELVGSILIQTSRASLKISIFCIKITTVINKQKQHQSKQSVMPVSLKNNFIKSAPFTFFV